jgi:hypothetical protein
MGISKLYVLPRKGQADWDEHSSALEHAVQAFYPIADEAWQRCVTYVLLGTSALGIAYYCSSKLWRQEYWILFST